MNTRRGSPRRLQLAGRRAHALLAAFALLVVSCSSQQTAEPAANEHVDISKLVTYEPDDWPSATEPFINKFAMATSGRSVFVAVDMADGTVEVREYIGTKWQRSIVVEFSGVAENEPRVYRQGETLVVLSSRCAKQKSDEYETACEGDKLGTFYGDVEIRRVELATGAVTDIEVPEELLADTEIAYSAVTSHDVLAVDYNEPNGGLATQGSFVLTNSTWHKVSFPVQGISFNHCATQHGIAAVSSLNQGALNGPSLGDELWSLNQDFTTWEKQSFGIEIPDGARVTINCADNEAYVQVQEYDPDPAAATRRTVYFLGEETAEIMASTVEKDAVAATPESFVVVGELDTSGEDETTDEEGVLTVLMGWPTGQAKIDPTVLETFSDSRWPLIQTQDTKTTWIANGSDPIEVIVSE